MFHPLPLYIGLRYARARAHRYFVSFITWVSLAGVAVGVAALIVILSVMNGFEFVESFEKLSDGQKQNYHIYMLSSSINENDIARVKGYKSVKQFLNKPLTNNTINAVFEGY